MSAKTNKGRLQIAGGMFSYLKNYIPQIAIFLLTAGGLFFLYNEFILQPKIAFPQELASAKKILEEQKLVLVDSRVALVGLKDLDPTSQSFIEQRSQLIQTQKDIYKNENKKFETYYKPNTQKIKKPNELELLNEVVGPTSKKLSEKGLQVLKKQNDLINDFEKTGQVLTNLYKYNARVDLVVTLEKNDIEDLINRIATTKNGLEKTRGDSYDFNEEKLTQQINSALRELDTISTLIEQKSYDEAKEAMSSFSDVIDETKRTAYDLELRMIRSDDSLNLLLTHTNLILEYDFLIDKLESAQKYLNNKIF